MIRRLLEAHYFAHREVAQPVHVEYWLKEMRSAQILIDLALADPELCRKLAGQRPILRFASSGDKDALRQALAEEERQEREEDRAYWLPLKAELQRLRRERLRQTGLTPNDQ